MPLKDAGWTSVEGRDAICKEFNFVDFNQVLFFCASLVHMSPVVWLTCCLMCLSTCRLFIVTWPEVSIRLSAVA